MNTDTGRTAPYLALQPIQDIATADWQPYLDAWGQFADGFFALFQPYIDAVLDWLAENAPLIEELAQQVEEADD